MRINVVNVSVENKGKYSQAEVFFKKDDGSAGSKKLMSFGAGAKVFNVLKDAKQGDNFDIVCVKNDKGFWDWTDFNGGGSTTTVSQAAPAASGGNSTPSRSFETAEERAVRQRLIVRQSSLTTAIEFLKLNYPKGGVELNQVFELAESFDNFVFQRKSRPAETGSIAELEDDIPL